MISILRIEAEQSSATNERDNEEKQLSAFVGLYVTQQSNLIIFALVSLLPIIAFFFQFFIIRFIVRFIFNFFLVIPQLVAASALGFALRAWLGGQPMHVLVLGGCSLLVAGLCVLRVPSRPEVV